MPVSTEVYRHDKETGGEIETALELISPKGQYTVSGKELAPPRGSSVI